jgi:hypothetical protein
VTYIADCESCPECDTRWKWADVIGEQYSVLVGIYDSFQDRTVAWQCPVCEHRWPRGATVDG